MNSEKETEQTASKEREAAHTPPAPERTPPSTLEADSRLRRFLKSISRWVLVALISFLIGILLTYAFIHRPVLEKLDQANADIAQLQTQVETLTPLIDENAALQEEANEAKLHATILSLSKEFLEARLALQGEDSASAHVALAQTDKNLNSLKDLLPSNYGAGIDEMTARLKLVNSQLDRDRAGALADLERLSTSLMELENALFTSP